MLRILMIALAVAYGSMVGASERGAVVDWAGAAFGADIRGPSAGAQVSTDDLLRLRDLGTLSLSPDGRWLAFCVYQAVPERDDYVLRWFIVPTDGSAPPSAVDVDGGQPIPSYSYGLPQASIDSSVALWSPDGTHVAFRRLVDHRIELWIASIPARQASRVYADSPQVTAFAWTSTGEVVFRTGLDYERYEQNLEAEARHGWLLDSRVDLFAARARPAEPDCALAEPDPACKIETLAVERVGRLRSATRPEAAALEPPDDQGPNFRALGTLHEARSDGAVAFAELANAEDEEAEYALRRVATTASGARKCGAPACVGSYIKKIGWAREGRSIWFLKSEDSLHRPDGAPGDQTGLYEWRPDTSLVRTVLRIEGRIDDCHVNGSTAYCMRETVTQPRQIVAIDLDGKGVRVLADPNPAFARKEYPRVRKVMLQDLDGNPAFAHVVYPNDYQSGKTYPLVITQYRSRGFLRGNVGNEYPVFPLAGTGFFVISLDRPENTRLAQKVAWKDVRRAYSKDLRGRENVLHVVEQVTDSLIAEGLVDKDRVAITGLSAGAESVHYALQRTDRFATAIASSGVHDVTFFAIVPEGAWRDYLMKNFDTDEVIPPESNSLYQLSWSKMPEKLRTPLLINVGDNELMIGFEGIQALIHAHRPVETRIFPDEMHVKYHPRTYAGIFENNMMWLKFWLKGEEDPRPEFAGQYARWRKMKEQQGRPGNPQRTSGAP
ncbi:MAG: Atxe2 family lasso peptide isopeptidase [Gammaproteobacteria bacterium]